MKKIFIVLTFIFISLLSFADNTNVGVRIPLGEQKVELDNNLKFLLGLTKVENSTKYKKLVDYVDENLNKKGVVKYSASISLKKGARGECYAKIFFKNFISYISNINNIIF